MDLALQIGCLGSVTNIHSAIIMEQQLDLMGWEENRVCWGQPSQGKEETKVRRLISPHRSSEHIERQWEYRGCESLILKKPF